MPVRREQVAAALEWLGSNANPRERFRRMISLDQPQDSDAADVAIDIAAGFTPLQYPQAARDFTRAKRENDPLGMGLATLAAVPVVGGVAKAANVARKVDVAAERAEALLAAQRNAAKPVSEGGLGLRPDNTPMERAAAMGFEPENPLYHGSLHNIERINLKKGDPGAFVGQGFYMTPSPEDASINYASIYGPDISARIGTGLEDVAGVNKNYWRTQKALEEETLSPARAEAVVRNTGTGQHLGAVYPLLVKRGKEANMVNPERSAQIGPGEVYDEAADEYLPTENASAWADAFNVLREHGVDTPDELYDLHTGGGSLDEIWNAIGERKNLYAHDPETGNPVTSGGLASKFVEALGANTVTHSTDFRNQQLNIAGEHTVALQPTGIVRSKFAAFDPAKLTSPDLLAGVAGPTVLAAALMEQERRKKERKEKGL
jgi:hypothetical protein